MFVDPRFYAQGAPLGRAEIATVLGTELDGLAERQVSGIGSPADAGPSDICFIENERALSLGGRPSEGLCLTTAAIAQGFDDPADVIVTANPRFDFFRIASHLYVEHDDMEAAAEPAIHETARVAKSAVIGDGAAIGARTRIGHGAVIGPGVQIGSDCVVGANATLRFALVGNGVKLLGGVRLGEQGFGLMMGPDGLADTPHFGRVVLQDGVSVGANSCIDRGLLGDTVIGESSKIDNMCHIGHNTQIGRYVVIAAYGGISGSVIVEDGVSMGGRVGIIDHIHIGAGARLAAAASVFSDVPAGETWGGMPAKPLRQWQRERVWLRRNAAGRADR